MQRPVVEIDAGYHGERAATDARRDAVLARGGYRIRRPNAALVERDIETAVSLVRGVLKP